MHNIGVWIGALLVFGALSLQACRDCPVRHCGLGCPPGQICVASNDRQAACPLYACAPIALDSAPDGAPSAADAAPEIPRDLGVGRDSASPIADAARPMDASLDDARVVDAGPPPADAAPHRDQGPQDAALDAASVPDGPPRPPSFQETVAGILADRGVPRITARFDEDEVRAQAAEFGGAVTFESALDDALRSYLEDGADVESPVALLEFAQGPLCDAADATMRVRCFLDDPSSRLGLVGAEGFPPENGESIAENWVITLDIPRLSDHLHWAIVHRAGAVPTYNYGFN